MPLFSKPIPGSVALIVGLLSLSACGQSSVPTSSEGSAVPVAATAPAAAVSASQADLGAVKSYLLEKAGELKGHTAQLKGVSDRYYELAKATNFDYAALWASKQPEAVAAIEEARVAWVAASPGYERIEGIVAGVPSLADYDVILDAGSSGADGGDNVAPIDLTLADGRMLEKPGNLFGVTESTLWGTEPTFRADVAADFDGDGTVAFGESLPDANVLKAGADALDRYVGELQVAAQGWQPTEQDAFTALVRMVPTMSEYFDSWKNSRFVLGEQSTQRDFVAISRLADIQDILGSLQVVHDSVSPLIKGVDPSQDVQIEQQLSDLKSFVAGVHDQEQSGNRFTPEDADTLGAEAQNRATAITGQIAQVAAQLKIPLE